MTSGHVVLCGRTNEEGPLTHHCYTGVSSDWTKVKEVKWCHHGGGVNIECVIIEGKEVLAVSCVHCCEIWLHDLETGGTSVAFRVSGFSPGQMCLGEPGQMFVVDSNQVPRRVLLLDCSSADFNLIEILPFTVQRYNSVCYIGNGYWLYLTAMEYCRPNLLGTGNGYGRSRALLMAAGVTLRV